MARNSAVAAAQKAFFDRDWSRIRGSVPRARAKQMARAAMGHSPAIFKAIRDGGTHNKTQLRNQLEYLTTKSSFIIDSRGTYDGQSVLSAKEIEQVARRFSAQWNEGFHPKLGHTSHLLMAFPIGTRGEDVAEITREICERFFQGEGSHFDYIAAVHEDRDHPHAHIVLNRRSKDGEFFFLKEGHHFNYDSFREAMVEVSDRYGLRLEATRKLERGITTKRPSDVDQRRAEATGQKLTERERVGPELDCALADVAQYARLYRGLAAEASRENQHDIAAALDKAATLLAQGNPIEADGKVYGMAEEQHSFDEVVDAFHDKINQAERIVADAPVERRAALETLKRDGTVTAETLLAAFFRPIFDLSRDDPRWRDYARLVAFVSADERWRSISAACFDPTAELFLTELLALRPTAHRAEVAEAFVFSVSAMLALLTSQGRIAALGGEMRAADAQIDHLIRFCAAGLAPA